jgi:hypothetical protein
VVRTDHLAVTSKALLKEEDVMSGDPDGCADPCAQNFDLVGDSLPGQSEVGIGRP